MQYFFLKFLFKAKKKKDSIFFILYQMLVKDLVKLVDFECVLGWNNVRIFYQIFQTGILRVTRCLLQMLEVHVYAKLTCKS